MTKRQRAAVQTLVQFPKLLEYLPDFEVLRRNFGLPACSTIEEQVMNMNRNHCSAPRFINDMNLGRMVVRLEKEKRRRNQRSESERRKSTIEHETLFKNSIRVARSLNNNKQITLRGGFVYLIENPVFPGCFKIGCSVDVEKRLQSYQTSDPYRRFRIVFKRFVPDRRIAEQEILKECSDYIVSREWVMIDKSVLKKIFREIQKRLLTTL